MTMWGPPPTISDTEDLPVHDTRDAPSSGHRAQDVRKVYKSGILEVEAVRGVTATIEEGEFVAIMGPRVRASRPSCTSSAAWTSRPRVLPAGGQDVGRMSEVELAHVRNRRIGFVFQQYNLLPTMTAWRNVELPLTYANVDKAERRGRAMEALERVGIAHMPSTVPARCPVASSNGSP